MKYALAILIIIMLVMGSTIVVKADEPLTTTLYRADSITDFDLETARPLAMFSSESNCHKTAFSFNQAFVDTDETLYFYCLPIGE